MYKTDNQKDRLYSTRNYIENLIITCKIKEYEKKIYMYISESLWSTPEINTIL